MTVSAEMRRTVIDGALNALDEAYVFPDVARAMETAIRMREARGEYDAITSARQLAETLTRDLRLVSRDRHLSVGYSPQPLPPGPSGPPSPQDLDRMLDQQRQIGASTNFGFHRVERLPGNIGYLDLRSFYPVALSAEAAAAAMTFLSNTTALIIDVRENTGGDPGTVTFLAGYLLGTQSVHFNDIYDRPRGETRQFWTTPHPLASRFAGKDVYVLTSARTFSGGEEVAYGLKNLKRALVIGEPTGGGAHPVSPHRISEHFTIGVPFGRPINPVTKANWEGTGVEPDVKIDAERALAVAHLMALEKEQSKAAGYAPAQKAEIDDAVRQRRQQLGNR